MFERYNEVEVKCFLSFFLFISFLSSVWTGAFGVADVEAVEAVEEEAEGVVAGAEGVVEGAGSAVEGVEGAREVAATTRNGEGFANSIAKSLSMPFMSEGRTPCSSARALHRESVFIRIERRYT